MAMSRFENPEIQRFCQLKYALMDLIDACESSVESPRAMIAAPPIRRMLEYNAPARCGMNAGGEMVVGERRGGVQTISLIYRPNNRRRRHCRSASMSSTQSMHR